MKQQLISVPFVTFLSLGDATWICGSELFREHLNNETILHFLIYSKRSNSGVSESSVGDKSDNHGHFCVYRVREFEF